MITSIKLNGITPIESVMGETLDILEYIDFDFYDLVWYHTGKHPRVINEHRALGL